MNPSPAALNLKVPRSQTALMQHLLMLVVLGHWHWCGGVVSPDKLPGLLAKFEARYPIARSERGRSYDRSKDLASVHFVAFPHGGTLYWWLLSSEGKGGLADLASPDAHVAQHAGRAGDHVAFGDYVLLYAHKESARKLTDARTGKQKVVVKNTSAWTWKMTRAAVNEVRATIGRAVKALDYGAEETERTRTWGLRGILQCQRTRPLFGGVRQQVIELHGYADSEWGRVRKAWLGKHTQLSKKFGDNAGALRPAKELREKYLPKMRRLAVYDDPPRLVRDLVASAAEPLQTG